MMVLLVGLLILVCALPAAITNCQLTTFRRMTLPNYSSASLGQGWQSETLLSCVRTCLAMYASCYSVTYNTNSGMCTPGSRVAYIEDVMSRAPGEVFYFANFCPGHRGLHVYLFDSLVQCVHISFTKISFISAKQDCIDRGSRLYIARSNEKLAFFRHVVNSMTRGNTWVGLTDLTTEGVFVWDDGVPVASSTFVVPWRPGNPDDAGGREDCVEMGSFGDFLYFNDQYCGDAANFICEIDII